jgi:hypothetical protein
MQRMQKAEGEGFEPSVTFATPVFKTGAIGRSATPPAFGISRGILGFFHALELYHVIPCQSIRIEWHCRFAAMEL